MKQKIAELLALHVDICTPFDERHKDVVEVREKRHTDDIICGETQEDLLATAELIIVLARKELMNPSEQALNEARYALDYLTVHAVKDDYMAMIDKALR